MERERRRIRLRRPRPPDGLRRLPWGYAAALLALLVSAVFFVVGLTLHPLTCGTDAHPWCSISGALLWGLAGLFVGIVLSAWLLRLGWLFALSFIGLVLGLVPLADRVQNLLSVAAFLAIPVVAAAASVRWTTPRYKGWQFWLAIVVSVGLIVWSGFWLLG